MVRVRQQHWELEFDKVVKAARVTPYQLGVHDCFKFACDIVRALTGDDKWQQFEGRYSTKRESLALLAQHGSTFEEAGDWFFGESIDVNFAQKGDIGVYIDDNKEKHLGVFDGKSMLVLGGKGLVPVSRRTATYAWRVG